MKLWWRLIRFGFRLLYNEMAFTYDLVSQVVSLGQWRCWQRSALKHLDVGDDTLVLELAHGTGDLQSDLNNSGYQTIGYDLSPYMGQIARRKLSRRGVTPRLIRGKAQQLPFPSAAFDVVVSTFPTEFVYAAETLQEVHRVLRPGGRFVIVINGVFMGRGVVVRFLQWLYRITGQRADTDEKPEQFTQVIDLFAAHGFSAQVVREQCRGSFVQVILAQA